MKYIAIILASVTLFLSLIPCSDGADKTGIYAIEKAMTHSDSGDHQEDQHQDGCTPFCTCNCCASGAALLFNTYQIISPTFFTVKNTLLFDQSGLSQFNHSIWQPPKI